MKLASSALHSFNIPGCLLWLTVFSSLAVAQDSSDSQLTVPPGVEHVEINIHDNSQANPFMDFYLRMPAGWEQLRQPSARSRTETEPQPVRVLLMSPYRHTDQNVSMFLANPKWTAFADKNRLALVTANVGKLTMDIKNRRTCYYYPEEYSGQALQRSLREFRKMGFPLMEDGMLLHGISAGAQWAHRLVLWKPKMALGVFCHVGSFYDLPKASDRGAIWLISTGYLDSNSLEHSRAFYLEARKRTIPCLLKIYPTLGHESNEATGDMARAFFQTLLNPPISADAQKALIAYGSSSYYGYVKSNETFEKSSLPAFQPDDWFCPLLGKDFAETWKRNK
ncbi:hypothetical protein BH11VER1_BH11VER1_34770 [soil metagenome]